MATSAGRIARKARALLGEAGLDGRERYGRPMLYAIFPVILAAPSTAFRSETDDP